jgi:hypothetical protein
VRALAPRDVVVERVARRRVGHRLGVALEQALPDRVGAPRRGVLAGLAQASKLVTSPISGR